MLSIVGSQKRALVQISLHNKLYSVAIAAIGQHGQNKNNWFKFLYTTELLDCYLKTLEKKKHRSIR